MMVLFDLPVLTKPERKAATRFRQFLLDQGFEMSQFSVYLRFCSGKEQVETLTGRIGKNVPSTGKVHILCFTDRQYENMVCFDGRARAASRRNPEQYVLF
ncbi:CRISPR-associated endonuclease Cas2 [Azospirillum oleiclasticum]|nr:CRISPR-associated endonuclease Cas2 [Azospirillum oleiclasticum]